MTVLSIEHTLLMLIDKQNHVPRSWLPWPLRAEQWNETS